MAKQRATIYLDADIRTATKVAAAAGHKSESDVVEEALRQYLQTDEQARAREGMRELFGRLEKRQKEDQSLRLTEEEAMQIANDELHAMRAERDQQA